MRKESFKVTHSITNEMQQTSDGQKVIKLQIEIDNLKKEKERVEKLASENAQKAQKLQEEKNQMASQMTNI